jgi:seryl-tRNA synthetase
MIDYNLIAKSIEHYSKEGYVRIESPWTVARAISNITRPPDAKEFELSNKDKVLVASGEQSFLALYNKGFLPLGKYQTCTPCFRDETFTLLHTKYFIKNELIITDDVSEESLHKMIDAAVRFFKQLGLDVGVVETERTQLGKFPAYDIYYMGDELGSYGMRHCDYLTWVYGTGCAEPRLSRVMEANGIPH